MKLGTTHLTQHRYTNIPIECRSINTLVFFAGLSWELNKIIFEV